MMIVSTKKRRDIPPYLIVIMKSEFDALCGLNFTDVDDPTTDGISLLVDKVVQRREVYISIEITWLSNFLYSFKRKVTTSINLKILTMVESTLATLRDIIKQNVGEL